jgi:hypothetical protein
VVDEPVAIATVDRRDALGAQDVRPDPVDRDGLTATSSDFIKATAGPSPSLIARATMAWPMLSSTTSGSAATAVTFV